MGSCVRLYVEVDNVSPEDLLKAERVFIEKRNSIQHPDRLGHFLRFYAFGELTDDVAAYAGRPDKLASRVEVYSIDRPFDPWNPKRGDWPRIRRAIETLQVLWPDKQVFLGTDSWEVGQLVTLELLREHDDAWAIQEEKENKK